MVIVHQAAIAPVGIAQVGIARAAAAGVAAEAIGVVAAGPGGIGVIGTVRAITWKTSLPSTGSPKL
jgi:hypothetical protein